MSRSNARSRPKGADWRAGGGAETASSPGLLSSLNRVLSVAILFGVVAVGTVWIWPEVQNQKVIDAEIAQIEDARDSLKERRDRIREELRWSRYDSDYLELKARDQLDLHRPGEVIIHIEREEP